MLYRSRGLPIRVWFKCDRSTQVPIKSQTKRRFVWLTIVSTATTDFTTTAKHRFAWQPPLPSSSNDIIYSLPSPTTTIVGYHCHRHHLHHRRTYHRGYPPLRVLADSTIRFANCDRYVRSSDRAETSHAPLANYDITLLIHGVHRTAKRRHPQVSPSVVYLFYFYFVFHRAINPNEHGTDKGQPFWWIHRVYGIETDYKRGNV